MAIIIQDHVPCDNCGNSYFKEEIISKIKTEALRADRNLSEVFSDRFLDDKHIRYVCAKCGSTLNA